MVDNLTKSMQKKIPRPIGLGILGIKSWQCPTFAWGDPKLSSALNVFTSEFEMGSGGSRSLWSPDKTVSQVHYTSNDPSLNSLYLWPMLLHTSTPSNLYQKLYNINKINN